MHHDSMTAQGRLEIPLQFQDSGLNRHCTGDGMGPIRGSGGAGLAAVLFAFLWVGVVDAPAAAEARRSWCMECGGLRV